MKTKEEQVEEDLRKRINSKSSTSINSKKSIKLQEQKERGIEPSSPSHPKHLYGSASSMTTNWDW